MLSGSASRSNRSTGRAAFTLIELLVVIAIIAILAAILFPVFAQAREKARQTACLSNMKQMALSLMQYSQDYDELFPLATNEVNPDDPTKAPVLLYDVTWVRTIQPYTKSTQIFVCPSTKIANEPDSTPTPADTLAYTGKVTNLARKGPIWDYGIPSRANAYWGGNIAYEDYASEFNPAQTARYDGIGGWNYGGVGTPRYNDDTFKCDSLSQAQVVRPSEVALVVESRDWDHGGMRNGDLGPDYIRTRHLRETGVNIGASTLRPNGWANTVFVDGHAKAMRPENLYKIDTAPEGFKYYRCFYGAK